MDFDRVLAEASRHVADPYFLLPQAGGGPCYRERVYCYELYHQMRCCWPTDSELILQGEVTKNAHPLLKELNLEKTPDFLVHKPGDMDGNFAIIEVKTCAAPKGALFADIEKIHDFRVKAEYEKGILLVFGEDSEKLAGGVAAEAKEKGVELWVHTAGDKAACVLGNPEGALLAGEGYTK